MALAIREQCFCLSNDAAKIIFLSSDLSAARIKLITLEEETTEF